MPFEYNFPRNNINKVESVVVGRDHFDGTPCERQINCANPECNKQILVSQENEDKYLGGCSIECSRHPRNRYVALHKLTSKEIEKRIKY